MIADSKFKMKSVVRLRRERERERMIAATVNGADSLA